MAPDRVETGGHLFSNDVPSQRGPVIITKASEPPPGTEHSRGQVRMRNASYVELPEWLGHLTNVGGWHSHPSHGDKTPSRADRQTWAEILRSSQPQLPYYIGILATPPKDMGWMFPELTAYVTYQVDGTRYRCELARIEGR